MRGNKKIMYLSELKPGEIAKITDISDNNKSTDRQRLASLGIIEGTKIEALYKSPSGNPVAYLVRGTVFALRNDTAGNITVEM